MEQNITLYEAVRRQAVVHPNVLAVYYQGKRFTFKKFLKKVDNMADILQNRLNIKQNDVVLIAQPNIPDALTLFYACNKIGAIANMVHPFIPYNQTINIFLQTNCKIAFLFEQRVAKEVDNYRHFSDKVFVTRIEDDLPFIKKVIYHFLNTKIRNKLGKDHGFNGFNYVHKLKTTNKGSETVPNSNGTSVLLHSGSTTGDPKTICLNNFSFNFLADHGSEFYCVDREQLVGTGMLCILPSFHGFGLCMSMHTPFYNGFACLLMPKFSCKETVKYMNKTKKMNCIIAIPSVYDKLAEYPDFKKSKNLKLINICWCGGDAMNPAIKKKFDECIANQGGKGKVFEGYGLTEALAANCVNSFNHYKEGSIGYPASGVEFACFDENEKRCKTNEIGEICIKSPAQMVGYLNDDKATKEATRNGWLHTGDLGYIDDDGFVFFKQRIKRVVKVSGVGVFPSEVEKVVQKISGVKQVCAISIPDKVLGNALKLYVVVENKYNKANFADVIMDVCKKYLIRWAIPKQIEFIDEMPMTLLGKVNYRALQDKEDMKNK